VAATLYFVALSHPAHAARLMLEHKRVEHRLVRLLPGSQPVVVKAAGFRGHTVPALKLAGERIQGSREISRALEERFPEPALFGPDRAAVEAAEAWGEAELQPVPRRIFRWGATRDTALRRWVAADAGIPLPAVSQFALKLPAALLTRDVGATEATSRADVAALPALLDRVDTLIADGVIGGEQRNAADFQIGTSVRVLLGMADLAPLIEDRPAGAHARSILPDYPSVPPYLPREWLEGLS
jgi:glutathione S-transferase